MVCIFVWINPGFNSEVTISRTVWQSYWLLKLSMIELTMQAYVWIGWIIFLCGCNTILEMAISEQKCRFVDSLASTICYGTIFLRLLRFSTMENIFLILLRMIYFRMGVLKTVNLSFRPKVDIWRINIDKWGRPLEVRGHMELDGTATRTLQH